jgi:DNA polymerase/3'-5' exonuclease PolX
MSAAVKFPYPVVLPIAGRIVEALRPYCERIEIAGSLRREKPMVGDIEIVAIPRRPVDLFGEPVSMFVLGADGVDHA